MLPVFVLSLARRDLQDAIDWFEDQDPKLAVRFKDAFFEAINLIGRHPEIYALLDEVHRVAPVSPFPCRFIYRVLPDRIKVVVVYHESRRPSYWMDRLDDAGGDE